MTQPSHDAGLHEYAEPHSAQVEGVPTHAPEASTVAHPGHEQPCAWHSPHDA
jgi:hypothetical protein